ncbi:hypothetical protein ACIO8G_00310 [Streptomyces sp. NPDC087219]|uniref:hypothetical protein n=1 Tax=Streptomyces sp. NPDC087219 TaxID=3365770 RepID=UPI003820AD7C
MTQRHPGSADAAGRAFDALVATLIAAGHELVAQERQLVLSDSDLSLDDGWLDDGWLDDGWLGDGGLDENQLGESRLGKGRLQEAVRTRTSGRRRRRTGRGPTRSPVPARTSVPARSPAPPRTPTPPTRAVWTTSHAL